MKRPINHGYVWIIMTVAVGIGWGLARLLGYGSGFLVSGTMIIILFIMTLAAAVAFSRYKVKLFDWYINDNPKAVRSLYISQAGMHGYSARELAMTQDSSILEYTIVVRPENRLYSQKMSQDCEMSQYLFRKACNSFYSIECTKILAVNNEQVAHTSTSPSVGGALLGGLVFGAPGFILGAAHSHSSTRIENGENEYTFAILFRDGRRQIMKNVKESSSTFDVLVKFLDMN